MKQLEKIFSLFDSGFSVFIVTKQNHLMPYEITYKTTYSDEKVFDEGWQINIEDIEHFEIAYQLFIVYFK